MLDDLESLLVSVALGEVPNRENATAYSSMRLTLLQTYDASVVPGFLSQCISIYKYREFINLYDGRPEQRRQFINEIFDRLHSVRPAQAGTKQDIKPEFASRVF